MELKTRDGIGIGFGKINKLFEMTKACEGYGTGEACDFVKPTSHQVIFKTHAYCMPACGDVVVNCYGSPMDDVESLYGGEA